MAGLMGSRAYCCFKCQNLVAFHDDIVSKDFQVLGWSMWFAEFLFLERDWAKEEPTLKLLKKQGWKEETGIGISEQVRHSHTFTFSLSFKIITVLFSIFPYLFCILKR